MNVFTEYANKGGGGGKARQVTKAGLNNLDEDAEIRLRHTYSNSFFLKLIEVVESLSNSKILFGAIAY